MKLSNKMKAYNNVNVRTKKITINAIQLKKTFFREI